MGNGRDHYKNESLRKKTQKIVYLASMVSGRACGGHDLPDLGPPRREKRGSVRRILGSIGGESRTWTPNFGDKGVGEVLRILGVTMKHRSRILEARGDNGEGRGRGAWLPDFDFVAKEARWEGGQATWPKSQRVYYSISKKADFVLRSFSFVSCSASRFKVTEHKRGHLEKIVTTQTKRRKKTNQNVAE